MPKNSPPDIIKSKFYNEFLYGEIVKRHIEEYELEICLALNQMMIGLRNKYENYENVFHVIVGEALDQYRQYHIGCKPICPPIIQKMMAENPEIWDFDNKEINFSFLYELSKECNIIATEIPFPVDMADVVANFSEKFIPPNCDIFNIDTSDNFRMYLDTNGTIYGIPLVQRITEDDNNKMKVQFILDKINNGHDISEYDKRFYNKYSVHNIYSDIRIDSFIKYVIGLYCWDEYKKDGKRVGYELYQKHQQKFNKCNESKCFKEMEFDGSEFRIPKELAIDFSCNRIETCKKFVREAFKLVGTCIQDCKLYNSKHKCNFVYPKRKNFFERKPISFFRAFSQ